MKTLKKEILSHLKKILPLEIKPEIMVPENEQFGDYSTNVAFSFAKTEKTQPIKSAHSIINLILKKSSKNFFKKIEAVDLGFINFWIHDKILLKSLNEVLHCPKKWGDSKNGVKKTVMVEYFQPNVAKIMHVGHLRSAVIGDSLKRIFLSQGYHTVSDTHIGDWGTQFGILLYGYKKLSKDRRRAIEKNPIAELNNLYVEESRLIEEDPSRRDMAKEEFAKLERGDKENRKIWKWMVHVSVKEFNSTIKQLGLLTFNEQKGESAYELEMPKIVETALKKKIAKKNEDGSVVVDVSSEGLGEAVMLKSDGASTYLLRDLATINYRKTKWKLAKNLYVVDVRQSLHFKQVFRVAELLGFMKSGECEHIEFGFMSLPEGALSTRRGNVIALQSVVDDVISRAREVIREKNPDLKNADKVARMIGLGALKYFDLLHHRKSNVVFDKERSLSFDGNTAPYIQYVHARFRSILKRITNYQLPITNCLNVKMDEDERRLLVTILRFPEVVEDALKELAPNILANYLFKLSQKANEFYHSHPVTQEKDKNKRILRFTLSQGILITLQRGLYLLGIEAPEEM